MTFADTLDLPATTVRTPAVELHDVVKAFGSVAAVDGVSLSNIVALLVSNGAGKPVTGLWH